jgi:hypothetical protein
MSTYVNASNSRAVDPFRARGVNGLDVQKEGVGLPWAAIAGCADCAGFPLVNIHALRPSFVRFLMRTSPAAMH